MLFFSVLLVIAIAIAQSGTSTAQSSSLGIQLRKNTTLSSGRAPITVACISDTHGMHHARPRLLNIPSADILLFAGDAGLADEQRVKQLNTWLEAQRMPHKLVTFGNMDTWGGDHTDGQQALLPAAEVVVDRIVEVGGWRIFASPWTPVFVGVFQLADEAAATRLWSRLLPPDTRVDVLLTHGPPYGYGDVSRQRHIGDRALLKAVQALKQPPLLWVCGHVHASNGEHKVPHRGGDILLINAAAYNLRSGNPKAAPRLVELPSLRITRMQVA